MVNAHEILSDWPRIRAYAERLNVDIVLRPFDPATYPDVAVNASGCYWFPGMHGSRGVVEVFYGPNALVNSFIAWHELRHAWQCEYRYKYIRRWQRVCAPVGYFDPRRSQMALHVEADANNFALKMVSTVTPEVVQMLTLGFGSYLVYAQSGEARDTAVMIQRLQARAHRRADAAGTFGEAWS